MLAAQSAAGVGVSIGILDQVDADLRVVASETTLGTPASWTAEVYNPGSLRYVGRLRLDVRDNGTLVSRTWSDPVDVAPGAAQSTTLSAFDPSWNGSYTARLTFHYGTEEVTVAHRFAARPVAPDSLAIHGVRLYGDRLRFLLRKPVDTTARVTVQGNPTWRFEQQVISDSGTIVPVEVPYDPPHAQDMKLRIKAYTEDGTRFTRWSGTATELAGMDAVIGRLLDLAVRMPVLNMVFT